MSAPHPAITALYDAAAAHEGGPELEAAVRAALTAAAKAAVNACDSLYDENVVAEKVVARLLGEEPK